MDKKDIESYLSAVYSMRAQAYLTVTMVMIAIVSLAAFWSGYGNDFIKSLIFVCFGYVVLYNAEYLVGYPVNKRQLLKILKRQIDNDPESIRYLSQLKSKKRFRTLLNKKFG